MLGWVASLLVALCADAAIQNIFLGGALRAAIPEISGWLPILLRAVGWTAAGAATFACVVWVGLPRLTRTAFRSLLAGLVLGALAAGLWCVVMPPRVHHVTVIDMVDGQAAKVSFPVVPLQPGAWAPFGQDYAPYLEAFAAIVLSALVWGGMTRRRPV